MMDIISETPARIEDYRGCQKSYEIIINLFNVLVRFSRAR